MEWNSNDPEVELVNRQVFKRRRDADHAVFALI